jgi:hypothetical protein
MGWRGVGECGKLDKTRIATQNRREKKSKHDNYIFEMGDATRVENTWKEQGKKTRPQETAET